MIKQYPCGKSSCIFADCINIADSTDSINCDVAPCLAFGECPHRFGIKN